MVGVTECVLPIVGMVVTISPSFSLYKIVVFPAASKPTEKTNIYFEHYISFSHTTASKNVHIYIYFFFMDTFIVAINGVSYPCRQLHEDTKPTSK